MVLMGMDLPLEAVRRQIASGVDIIVHLGRLRDKSRRVLEIVEILGFENGEIVTVPIYQFIETGEKNGKVQGNLTKINKLSNLDKLKSAGL
jgi:pilus assembly protein CpaF